MAHFAKWTWNEYLGLLVNDRLNHNREVEHPENENEWFTQRMDLDDDTMWFCPESDVEDSVKRYHDVLLKDVTVMNRKDVKHVVSLTFTCPPDVEPADQRKCLLAAADFMAAHPAFGGDRNLLLVSLHWDETSPHLVYDFCPVTDDGRLSAKDVLTKKVMQSFHGELGRYLDDVLGYHISVETGKTSEKGNKSINWLKDKTAKEQVKALTSERNFFRKELQEKETLLNCLRRTNPEAYKAAMRDVSEWDEVSEADLNTRYEYYHSQRVAAGRQSQKNRSKER